MVLLDAELLELKISVGQFLNKNTCFVIFTQKEKGARTANHHCVGVKEHQFPIQTAFRGKTHIIRRDPSGEVIRHWGTGIL
jgi:hypothetical protein